MTSEVDHRPDLRVGIGLVVVVFASVGGLTSWAWSVRDRLPEPVARHWGVAGAADGFSSLGTTLVVNAGLVLALAVPLGLVAVVARQPVALRRVLAGTAAFLSVFVTVLAADALRGQLDLPDAAAAPPPTVGILLATVGGLVTAVAVAALTRSQANAPLATGRPPPDAPRLVATVGAPSFDGTLAGLDTAAWVLATVAGTVLLVVSAVVSWWLLPIAVLVAGLLVGMGRISCRIDHGGLSARALRIRILHVPIAEVAEADVVDVDPFWEFGGWGLRLDVAGRVGLVTRKGEAVRIRRGDGSQVLVTVGDAATAAATLNTLADDHMGR